MKRFRWLLAIVLGLIVVGLVWRLLPIEELLPQWVQQIRGLGALGVAVYFLLYMVLATLTFPTTPLAIGAGLLFDFWLAVPIAVLASWTAAMLAFRFARSVGRDWVQRKMSALPRFEQLIERLEDQGFKVVVLARLNPFIPASFKNFGLALTSVRFSTYALATFLGQLPVVLAHVYLGWAGGAALLRGDRAPSNLEIGLMIAGAVVSVALVAMLAYLARGDRSLPAASASS